MIKRLLFFLLLGVSLLLADKNVLVLHSYHHGLKWSDSISQGLIHTVEKSPQKINLYFEYLDAKRNSSPTFLMQTFQYFILKHGNTPFDTIIAVDNDALAFVNMYGDELFPSTPVIFCGINNFTSSLISNLSKVTGVKEVVGHAKTLRLAKELFPKRKHVLIGLDNTLTATMIKEEIEVLKPGFQTMYEFHYLWDFDEKSLQSFVENNHDDMVIYLSSYNRDKKGHFFGYSESVKNIKELVGYDIPIFGSWSFYLGSGIVGGAMTKGVRQGEMAAELAMKVLNGQDIHTLEIRSNEQEQDIALDYTLMQHFKLAKPKNVSMTQYINAPADIFIRYKIGIIATSLFLLIFSIVIFFVAWRKNVKNRLLKEINTSLELSVELALQESRKNEKLFKFIADSAHYVIWVVDMEHTLTYINPKVKEFFAQDPKHLLGKQNFEFLPTEYFDMLQENLQQLKDNASLEYVEFDIYCESIERHMKNYIVPISTHDGGVVGYKGVVHDITQEKTKLDTLKIEAQTDYLTGTLNRNTFEKELERFLIEYTRFSRDVCVMMLDVDFFKKINDTFGHFIGDYVLKKLAYSLKSQVRKSDFVFRYGGEEFAIVLPDITLQNAVIIAEKIRQLIESQNFKVDDKNVAVTLSIGLSMFEKEDQSINKVVIRADEALYRAKHNGRNRVEVNYQSNG